MAASPAAGMWQTPVNAAVIQVYDCGPSLICGRVLESSVIRAHPDLRDERNHDPALRGRLIKGMQMMDGFKGGPTRWIGGELYNPDDGRTYHAAITLEDAATLRLKGCIIGPLCGGQTWRRIN